MNSSVKKRRIVVAMSGGVDSSVTAALLKEEGHDVIGLSMRVRRHSTAPPDDDERHPPDNIHDAKTVARHLDIPFHVVDLEEEFKGLIIDYFIDEYFRGRTPNPCALCNQRIKFGLLMKKAVELGADFLATGHYARLTKDEEGRTRMLKGVDEEKDQSYFLFALTREQLSGSLFPLGDMTKREVHRLAARYHLPVADKGESQEICFIPDDDYVRLLEETRGKGTLSGNIVDRRGNVLGRHEGTYRFTVGQRKGLGIAHPHPLYVLGVDAARREVIVGAREELATSGLMASGVNWISPIPGSPIKAACKIRYRHREVGCTIIPLENGRAEVRFAREENGVTPGQAVVFYNGDEVLGGGWIDSGNDLFPQSRR
jgi:tRNA-specific 2-thiouridylase